MLKPFRKGRLWVGVTLNWNLRSCCFWKITEKKKYIEQPPGMYVPEAILYVLN